MASVVHLAVAVCAGGPYSPTWPSVTTHGYPEWFGRAKFGIYAHWGPYSVPAYGSEWYSRNMYQNNSDVWKHHQRVWGSSFGYKDFVPLFTGSRFDAKEWAELYAATGAKYSGPVAEHADGFCMWNTSYSTWNAALRGPQRDIVRELGDAIRGAGMKFLTTLHHQWLWAWYTTYDNNTDCSDPGYQLTEGHGGLYGQRVSGPSQFQHPDATQLFQDYFLKKATELVLEYGPDAVYFDSKWKAVIDDAHRLRFLASYYNDAEDRGAEVVVTYKSEDLEVGAGIIDFERGGAAGIQTDPWQTDDAVGRGSWSWVDPPNLKNSTELIGELVDVVSKNGNLLLDVPPHADGSFDDSVKFVMRDIGSWLKVNAAAIYSTKPFAWFGEGPTKIVPGMFHEWPMFTDRDFRFTTAGKTLFIFAMKWNDAGWTVSSLNTSAPLKPLGSNITSIQLIGGTDNVQWTRDAHGLHIQAPTQPSVCCGAVVFRATIDGSARGFLSIDPASSGSRVLWYSGAKEGNGDVEVSYRAPGGAPWTVLGVVADTGGYSFAGGGVAAGGHIRIRAADDHDIADVMRV